MSKKIFKDLTKKQSDIVEKIQLQSVKFNQKMVVKDGIQTTETDIENPEQTIENSRELENTFFSFFLDQVEEKEGKEEVEKIQNSRVLYDDFKQDVLDWATDNCILWVIQLKLCPKHQVIAEMIDENPKYQSYRQVTLQKEIAKWLASGEIDKRYLEKIKDKAKKK